MSFRISKTININLSVLELVNLKIVSFLLAVEMSVPLLSKL